MARLYFFGAEPNAGPIEIGGFHITTTPVTQALWTHVTGSRPVGEYQPSRPVANVSWDSIARAWRVPGSAQRESDSVDGGRIGRGQVPSAVGGGVGICGPRRAPLDRRLYIQRQ